MTSTTDATTKSESLTMTAARGTIALCEAVTSGREGWLEPPARADLLADAIVRLARDDETRKRMAESALAAGERYDMVRSARRIESLYRDLLG